MDFLWKGRGEGEWGVLCACRWWMVWEDLGRDCAVRSGFGIALIASASEMLVTMMVQGWFAWY